MADDVIKNPFRSIAKTQVPYEPEHVRKGIDVPEASAGRTVALPKADPMHIGIDGDNVDEEGNGIPFENGHFIDNNDYVNLGYDSMPSSATKNEVRQPEATDASEAPKVGEYILMVFGKLITSGSVDKIQSRVRDIMYGDDATFASLEITTDDIVVLKRVDIKVGIFVEG